MSIREIQLDLLQDWLNIILASKEKNAKAVADTSMSMGAIDKSIQAILAEFKRMLPERNYDLGNNGWNNCLDTIKAKLHIEGL